MSFGGGLQESGARNPRPRPAERKINSKLEERSQNVIENKGPGILGRDEFEV
jgi:hypothetical protein